MLEGAENFHNELITWVPLEGGAEGPFPMDSLVTLDTYYLCMRLNVCILPMYEAKCAHITYIWG